MSQEVNRVVSVTKQCVDLKCHQKSSSADATLVKCKVMFVL